MTGQVHAAALPWRYGALALVLSALVALAYLGLSIAPPVIAIEGQTLTWRFQFRGAIAPPPGISIAAIDDRTVSALRRWPLRRRELAAVVDKLVAAGAAAIGVDLLFVEREQPSNGLGLSPGDQTLVDALRSTDRDVLALAVTVAPDTAPSEAALEIARGAAFPVVRRPTGSAEAHALRASGILAPIEPLPSVTRLAHVHTPEDSDGVLRHMPAAVVLGEYYVPALPVALAHRYQSLAAGEAALMLLERGVVLGEREFELEPRLRLPINFYGPAGTVPTFSVVDLLEDRVPASAIAGRIVLLGATALGLGDHFVTPFRQMPGVEVLATITGNLLDGTLLQRAALRDWNVAAILLLGLTAFALARLPSAVAVVGAAIGLLAAWIVIAQVAFQNGLWLDVTFPAAAILLNVGSVAVVRAMIERRMRRNLAAYHSPVIVDMLAQHAKPSFEGRSQNAAILFVDIAGFTSRAEGMSPADTVPLLRAFHGRIERAVLAHGGVLERFMGDGAMVIFGVPAPGPHDAAAALACARVLVDDIGRWNEELVAAGQKPLDVSVGIHYGPVVMARLGGDTQAEITPAGDTVNVASRIEKLTRDHDATIAISDAVVEAIAETNRNGLMAGFEAVPTQAIRGRIGRLSIWVRPRGR